MRSSAYHLFEIVAWPAAVWCALEVSLRTATGDFQGITATALTGACAALTIVACRLRPAQLAVAGNRR